MPSLRELYKQSVGQTSEFSLCLEVEKAKGCLIYTTDGKSYIDFNSGISVSSLGHCNPVILKAITEQASRHLHTMVYGEHIQESQVKLAQLLTAQLAENLSVVYYLLTGSEAVETAIKLARKYTGRYEILSARLSYHGSTLGAESLRSDDEYKMHFAPLIPGVKHLTFNAESDLDLITDKTACVIIEPVQAERGVYPPENDYLQKVQDRCKETGTLFILDEIQTGFGRTGSLFAHQKYGVTPDVMCIGKAMGGGLPLSAVVSSPEIISSLVKYPALGHITTFGGHPLSCAAGHAGLEYLLSSGYITQVNAKGHFLTEALSSHPIVKDVRRSGMLMAVEVTKRKYLKHVVSHAMELGVIVDYFLFNDRSFRLAPPLVIDQETLEIGLSRLLGALDYAQGKYA